MNEDFRTQEAIGSLSHDIARCALRLRAKRRARLQALAFAGAAFLFVGLVLALWAVLPIGIQGEVSPLWLVPLSGMGFALLLGPVIGYFAEEEKCREEE